MDLEDYIIGVIAGEMPALFEISALKAQAIASRSYVLSKRTEHTNIEISSTINDQVFLTKEEMQEKWEQDFSLYYEKIKDIVISTKDLVMKKNNKIIKSYYFAMSNGYTQDSQTVFGDNTFKSVESKWENENLRNFSVTTKFTKKELLKSLNISADEIIFSEINLTKTNHVDNLKVNNIIFTGLEVRKLLNLRSTDFTITSDNESYTFTTRGYGHGVGMSQYGANEMAKNGYSYEEILKHYYNDVQIEKF